MPNSIQSTLRVGDPVRDRQSLEEGRVTGVARLAGELLLVTVAFFIGKTLIRRAQFPVRPGQIAGLPVEKIEETVRNAAQATQNVLGGLIRHPDSGSVSARAVEKALKNEPPVFGESLSIRALKWAEANQRRLAGSETLLGPSRALGTMRERELLGEQELFTARREHALAASIDKPAAARRLQDSQRRLDQLRGRKQTVQKKIWDRHWKSLEAAYHDWRQEPENWLHRSPFRPGALGTDRDLLEWQTGYLLSRRQRLQSVQEAARQRKSGYDSLLDYLTRRSERTPEGKWAGGYLNDVLLNRKSGALTPEALQRHDQLAQLFRETGVNLRSEERAEFEQLATSLLGEGAGNAGSALDIFRFAVNDVRGKGSFVEQTGIWNERYAPLLRHLVERYHPKYRRDRARIQRTGSFGRRLDRTEEAYQHLLATPGYESAFLPVRANVNFQEGLRNELEADQQLNGVWRDWLEGHVGDPVGLDLAELRTPRRAGRLTPSQLSRRNLQQMLGGEPARLPRPGQSVLYGGVPFRVAEETPGGLILHPLGTPRRLVTDPRGRLFDPDAVLDLIRGLETPAAAEPALVGPVLKRTIQVRGGLRGIGTGLEEVPPDLLYAYLTGTRLTKAQGTEFSGWIQKLGFTSLADFESAQKTAARKAGRLFGRMPRGEIRELLRGQELGDVTSQFQTALFTGIEELPQGLSLDELRETARQGAWKRVLTENQRSLRGTNAVVNFSDLVRWTDEGEALFSEPARGLSPSSRGQLIELGTRPFEGERSFRARLLRLERRLTSAEKSLDTPIRQPGETLRAYNTRVAQEERILGFHYSDAAIRLPGESLPQYNARLAEEELSVYRQVFRDTFGEHTPLPNDLKGFLGSVREDIRLLHRLTTKPSQYRSVSVENLEEMRSGITRDVAHQMGVDLLEFQKGEREALRTLRKEELRARSHAFQMEVNRIEEEAIDVVGIRRWNLLSAVEREQARARVRQRGLSPSVPLARRDIDLIESHAVERIRYTQAEQILTRDPNFRYLSHLSPESAGFYNTVIEMLESGRITPEQLQPLNLPFQVVPQPRGKFAIQGFDPNDPAQRYLYRPHVGGAGGVATLASDPFQSVPVGLTEPVSLHGQALREALEFGKLRSLGRRDTDRLLQGMILPGAQEVSPSLPIFRAGDLPIGFSSPVASFGQVSQATQNLIRERGRFISFDIEFDPEGRRLLNVGASLYDFQGNLLEQGPSLALPEFWEKHDPAGLNKAQLLEAKNARIRQLRLAVESGETPTAAQRTIFRFGRGVEIGGVAGSEPELLREMVAFLEKYPVAALGHNVAGSDLPNLLEIARKHGMVDAEQALLRIAQERLVDTSLLAQIARPTASSLSVESLTESVLGRVGEAQTHVASPDERLTAEIAGKLLGEHGESILERLAAASQEMLSPGTLLWEKAHSRAGERVGGRAWEFVGTVDPAKASELFRQQTGKVLDLGGGLVLRPIDFRTGAAGAPQLLHWQTPAGMAKEFAANFERLPGMEAAGTRMAETAEDLARRRIRRIVGDEAGAFETLLKERERFGLAKAFGQGPEAYHAALDDLVQRAESAGETEARLLRATHAYAQREFTDSRIVRQLELQAPFWEEEMARHAPVVDSLLDYVRGQGAAGPDALKQADQLWTNYIGKTTRAADWARLPDRPVAPESLALNFPVEVHGRPLAPRSLRLTDPTTLQRDIDARLVSILKKLPEKEVRELLAGTETRAQELLLKERGKILDLPLGEGVRSALWEQYLQPALAQGSTVTAEGMAHGSFQLQAQALPEAMAELLQQGRQFAQGTVQQAPNELAPRAFAPGALEGLQTGFRAGNIPQLAAEALRPHNLKDVLLQSHHGVPEEFVGRRLKEVLAGIGSQGTEEAAELFSRRQEQTLEVLRRAARKFSGEEVAAARTVAPEWLPKLLPWSQLKPQVVAEAQPFHPGVATAAAERLVTGVDTAAESLGGWVGRNRTGAAIGAVAFASLAGLSLLRRAPTPTPTPHRPADRDETTVRTEQTHRVRVRVQAVDPHGADHAAILAGIHQAVGSHLDADLSHTPTVQDQRGRITKQTLEDLAGRLMTAP